MFPNAVLAIYSFIPTYQLFFAIAAFLGIFLFWRAGRHELLESDFLFDVIIISTMGALIGGRIFEFIIFSEKFAWSLKRLIFFNVYGGFDFYGALIGAIISCQIYLVKSKESIWKVLDLAAAPIVFSQSLIALGAYLGQSGTLSFLEPSLYYFVYYFLVFFLLKRLEQKKRHAGFFACFYLVSIAAIDILSFGARRVLSNKESLFPPHLIIATTILFFSLLSWYILARRNPKEDAKRLFALVLLAAFKIKRMLTSVEEIGEVAKFIIFLPVYIVRGFYLLTRIALREFLGGTRDFMHALGVKK